MRIDRRGFLTTSLGVVAATSLTPAVGLAVEPSLAIPDDGWSLWIDQGRPGRTTSSTCRERSSWRSCRSIRRPAAGTRWPRARRSR
ncbi:hypothetical protein ACRAWD_15250 [Caulobacter segnis]